jgi:hypothetical protein
MPITQPITASTREPAKPRPIPRAVRDMLKIMVYGKADDPNCQPLTFIDAAKECGIKPDMARRYLDRADVRSLLMGERRTFRAAIAAGNEAALERVRRTSANGMCVVAAVRTLEALDEDDARQQRGGPVQRPASSFRSSTRPQRSRRPFRHSRRRRSRSSRPTTSR